MGGEKQKGAFWIFAILCPEIQGMHFKWDRDRARQYGLSLQNPEALDSWPEAERKRREYYGRRYLL
jgi:hypothetical protein